MLEGLNAVQIAEMEAYSTVEADPEGSERREQRKQREDQERLDRQKSAFTRVAQDSADGNRSDP